MRLPEQIEGSNECEKIDGTSLAAPQINNFKFIYWTTMINGLS